MANVSRGYPEGALKRVQLIELGVLKEVARVCDQLGIEWFVDGGTALGARRHGGFIPWDDDIDIGMRLSDYRKFCEQAPALFSAEYGLYTPTTTENYPPLWAKAYAKNTRFMSAQMMEAGMNQGLFVDVFAYARVDANAQCAAKQMRRMGLWQRLSYLYHTSHPKLPENLPLKPLFAAGCVLAHHVVRALFSPEQIERGLYAALDAGDGQGPWVDIFYPDYGIYPDEVLFPTKTMAFEDTEMPVPHHIDTYLNTMYGNWQTLPPEEARGAYPPVMLDFGDGVNVMEHHA